MPQIFCFYRTRPGKLLMDSLSTTFHGPRWTPQRQSWWRSGTPPWTSFLSDYRPLLASRSSQIRCRRTALGSEVKALHCSNCWSCVCVSLCVCACVNVCVSPGHFFRFTENLSKFPHLASSVCGTQESPVDENSSCAETVTDHFICNKTNTKLHL